ncbi:hypothetical protein ABPG74_018158 [Tetrahymena malaccensis]
MSKSESQSMAYKRLEETQIATHYQSDPIPENPISQYNQVIEQYNLEYNKCEYKLELANCTLFYEFIFAILKKPLGKIILTVILFFLPLINFFFYFLLWNSYFVYSKAHNVYKDNKSKVSNPFARMIYSSEICELMNKNFYTFDISIAYLKNYKFKEKIIQELQNRPNQDNHKFMIYNTTFKNFYLDFPKYKNTHIIWLVWSTFLLAVFFGIFYLYIFYFVIQQS